MTEQMAAQADPLWTVAEVARYLRITPETVRNLARSGSLPAIKVGRFWRFKKEMIETYLMKFVNPPELME